MGGKREEIEYKRQRDTELLKAFYDSLGPGVTIKQAVQLAVTKPCSRFWVTPETAAKEISSLRRGHWYQMQKPKRMRMQRAYDIMVRCNGDYSITRVTEVVYSAAPQFYLSAHTAEKYIYRTLRNRKKEKGNGTIH
jgi:ribulose 1,5-bisphosphate carboxylase large subunit-like protein